MLKHEIYDKLMPELFTSLFSRNPSKVCIALFAFVRMFILHYTVIVFSVFLSQLIKKETFLVRHIIQKCKISKYKSAEIMCFQKYNSYRLIYNFFFNLLFYPPSIPNLNKCYFIYLFKYY